MRASSVTARLGTVLPVKDWAWWRLPWLLRIYIGAVSAAALALIAVVAAAWLAVERRTPAKPEATFQRQPR